MACALGHFVILFALLATISSLQIRKPRKPDTKTESAPCPEESFICANDDCIPLKWKCDGSEDCVDKSDELNCTDTSGKCKENEFTCNNTKCIPTSWRCDGTDDCSDNSDEINCKFKKCASFEFQCEYSKECLSKQMFCNGKKDCVDGTDEDMCTPCAEGEFKCHRKCIPMSKVCDGKKDCPKGEDESPQCGTNECARKNGRCDHFCTDIPIGHKCSCDVRYRLGDDKRSCHYVNICHTFGTCHQICYETNGNYTCDCADGYNVQTDRKSCKAVGEGYWIYFANREDIRKLSSDGDQYELVVKNLKNVISIDLDVRRRYIYWSDVVDNHIARIHLDKPDTKQTILTNVGNVYCIAIDWLNEKIYWTDSINRSIKVAELDGKNVATIVSIRHNEPLTVNLDPYNGYIYWTEMGYTSGSIGRISMDGNLSTKKVLVDENIFWPSGFTLDLIQQKMYWIDAKYKHVEVANMADGKNRILLKRRDLGMNYGLDNFEGRLFWTDVEVQTINSMVKFNTSSTRVVKRRIFAPMGIKIYHASKQREGRNPCADKNNGCSHLCLISNRNDKISAACKCPDGMKLKGNLCT